MQNPAPKDPRRYERFPCAQMVTIRPKKKGEAMRAIVVDVSLGGLKMRTNADLDASESYILTMASDGTPLDFNGTVVHLAPDNKGDEVYVGFVFRPESHDERVAIANFVHRVFTQAWHAEAA